MTTPKKLMAVIAIAILGMTGLSACSSDAGSGSGKESHRLAGGRLDPKQEPLEHDVYSILESDISQIIYDEGMGVDVQIAAGGGGIRIGWNWKGEKGQFYMSIVSGHGEAFFTNLEEELASKYCTATGYDIKRPSKCKDSFVEIDGNSHDIASMIAKQLTPVMKDTYDRYGEVEIKDISITNSDGETILDANADGDPSD